MAVEVIGRDVQQHSDVQARVLDRLELEARKLEHDPVVGRDLIDTIEDGVADVAADDDGPRPRRKHFARQRGRRRLAVRARDPDDRARAQAEKEFDLARDPNAARARLLQQFRVPRHARTRVHDVDAVEHRGVMAAESVFDSLRRHLREGRAQLLVRFAIGDAHGLAVRGQVPRQRDSAARRANDQRRQLRRRTREMAIRAETRPAPQNVRAMRFSDQPSWWNV